MEIYKESIRKKDRWQTAKGNLNLEQLAELDLTELNEIAVQLDDAYANSKGKSFLEKKTTKDKDIKRKFDIVLDLLNTKKAEEEAATQAAEDKKHNARIMEKIANLDDKKLDNMSRKELMAQLR